MRQIALYGKGGIGKSTTSANLSAAFATRGLSVLQIGCDPKRDSTRTLTHGDRSPTVLDLIRERGDSALAIDDCVHPGFGGSRCVEAGGPEPGVGCAGRGIIATFHLLERLGALSGDVIVYDVLGDVVCGGFGMPMREGYAEEVYLVTSGELMALYAANNICKAIARLSTRVRSRCRLAGIICNSRNVQGEEDLVREFADRIGAGFFFFVPRDRIVQAAELNRQTVIEFAPGSHQASVYRELSEAVLRNDSFTVPTPLDIEELESLAIRFLQE